MHKILFTLSLFHAPTCFEHHVLIIRSLKLYYTAFCIITLKKVSGLKLLKYNSINFLILLLFAHIYRIVF